MRIAVAQTPGTRLADWRKTLAQIEYTLTAAAARRAELVVLPECAWPAYCLESRQAYDAARGTGLPAPDVFLRRVQQSARQRGLFVCVGYVEEQGERLHNSASVIDPHGQILGSHRKCFLWDFDHDYFTAGNHIEPISTPLGRIGLMICADARLPEIPATLATRGAELILQPTAWVNAGSPAAPWNPQPDFLIGARAREFGVPIASASKWGAEGKTAFVGSSLICDAAGQVRARCPGNGTMIEIADVELGGQRPAALTAAEQAILRAERPPSAPRAEVNTITVQGAPGPGGGRLELRGAGRESSHTPLATFAASVADDAGTAYAAPQADLLVFNGACVGTLGAGELERFAAARCLALRGAHLVVVFGTSAPTGTLRTRACENRLFMAGLDEMGWVAVAPSGKVLHVADWSDGGDASRCLTLDLRQAVSKCVAPGTDVLADRRPATYTF